MVSYLSAPDLFRKFEQLYLQVRMKEQRVYDDEVVSKLPFVSANDTIHHREWNMRSDSFNRLQQYLRKEKKQNIIMDLGCGNGWLSSHLAKISGKEIYGVDINEPELIQADRVFKCDNLHFCYGNIYENIFPAEMFDVIIINSCIQYFENLPELIKRLFYLMKPGGEIHIIDSPLYKNNEIEAARLRTKNYYSELGFPEMAEHYFHHELETLKNFNYKNLSAFRLFRKLPKNFYWIRVIKRNTD